MNKKLKRIRLYCRECGNFIIKHKVENIKRLDISSLICVNCFKTYDKNKNKNNKNKKKT